MHGPRHDRAGRIAGHALIGGRVDARIKRWGGEWREVQRAVAGQMPDARYGEQAKLFEILIRPARVGGDLGQLAGQHPVDRGLAAGLAVQ